uniref:Uncharacterized protein n=1 Tax=Xiphophorus maculatus TaxID=8083 RepID=A0A3B5QPU5_XIPMA
MGANNSTRRVSFESDENDNITVVKGIRVSYRVDLLKETGISSISKEQRKSYVFLTITIFVVNLLLRYKCIFW